MTKDYDFNLASHPDVVVDATGGLTIVQPGSVERLPTAGTAEPRSLVIVRRSAGDIRLERPRVSDSEAAERMQRLVGERLPDGLRLGRIEVKRDGERMLARSRDGQGRVIDWHPCSRAQLLALVLTDRAQAMASDARRPLRRVRPIDTPEADVALADARYSLLVSEHADHGQLELKRLAEVLATGLWSWRSTAGEMTTGRAEGLVEEALRSHFAVRRVMPPALPPVRGISLSSQEVKQRHGWFHVTEMPWGQGLYAVDATCALKQELATARMIMHAPEVRALEWQIEALALAARPRRHRRIVLAALAGRHFMPAHFAQVKRLARAQDLGWEALHDTAQRALRA